MRLNHDYVRDILLFIESELEYENNQHKELMFGKLLAHDNFTKCDKDELLYALELLIQEEYINCARAPYFVRGNLMSADIIGLTWKGHELLDNVRNDTVWNAVKQKSMKFGKFSLTTLAMCAKELTFKLMDDPNAIQNFNQGIENIGKIFGGN